MVMELGNLEEVFGLENGRGVNLATVGGYLIYQNRNFSRIDVQMFCRPWEHLSIKQRACVSNKVKYFSLDAPTLNFKVWEPLTTAIHADRRFRADSVQTDDQRVYSCNSTIATFSSLQPFKQQKLKFLCKFDQMYSNPIQERQLE